MNTMPRRPSRRPVITTPPPTRSWHFDANAGVLRWGNGGEAGDLRGGASLALLGAAFVLACVLPCFLITEALLAAVAALRHTPYTAFGGWSDPLFWLPVLGTAGMAALLLFTLSLGATIEACEFDARGRTLTYTEARAGRRPRINIVPLGAVLSVRPRLMSSHATDGDFAVALRQSNGRIVEISLGRGTPLVALRSHARWLKTLLADRVQPTLQLDL
jgi:hypothetical protein